MGRKNTDLKERHAHILELVTKNKRIEVSALAEALGVSNVTMRKDLDTLESQGVLRREHGYAVLDGMEDISGRLAYHYESKQKIAGQAVSLIQDGDTVMIENGSCCALLAEEIATQRQDVTIVTNSAFIADFVRKKGSVHLVLLGGAYQNDSQVCVGPLLKQSAGNFFVSRLFIGTDGYTREAGFTNRDHMRAQAVRDMARQATEVIVLTESEKFSSQGVVPLNISARVSTIITDDNIPDSVREDLSSQGKTILTVPADGPLPK